MADNDDDSQKTEDPSQKKLDDARKKGQVIYSREVNNFFVLLTLCALVFLLTPVLTGGINRVLTPFIIRPHDYPTDSASILLIMGNLLSDSAAIMAIPLGLTTLAALVAGGFQTKFNIALDRIKPKLEKISVIKGLGRMFSLRNLVEFIKGIIKITVVGIIAYLMIDPYIHVLRNLPAYDTEELITFITYMIGRICIGVTCIVFFIALADYLYQRFEFLKKLRMTKQEVKDEYKQQEGDPQIKAKLRQLRMQRSRENMLANVPGADVVITNPTHYAIALQYDTDAMAAPVVVAIGKDKVALKIKEIAEDNRIPVFRNPPVARALHEHATVNEEIPLDYYEAVAKIIGYVYQMRGNVPRTPPRK